MATASPVPPTAKSTAERLFPRLTPAQIARVAAYGRTRTMSEGEVLFDAGDPAAPFLLVVAGEVAVRLTADGEEVTSSACSGGTTSAGKSRREGSIAVSFVHRVLAE